MIASNLVVNGSSRFLNHVYMNDLSVAGTTSFTSISASGAISAGGNITAGGNLGSVTGNLYLKSLLAINGQTDTWLRINASNAFTSGIYFGSSIVRTDGTLQVGQSGTYFNSNSTATTIKNLVAPAGAITTLNSTKITANTIDATDTFWAHDFEFEIQHVVDGIMRIAPTLRFPTPLNNGTSTTTAMSCSKSGSTLTITITDSSITTSTMAGIVWSSGSRVKVSGKIKGIATETMSGTISSISNGSLSVQVTGGNIANITATSTLSDFDDITVMVYERKVDSNYFPTGILINCYDAANKSATIKVYGGTSATPNVTVGNLVGLSFNGTPLPTNSPLWGIHTSVGYYEGAIVSTEGQIGGWTIGDTKLYNNTDSMTSTSKGLYLGTNGIRNFESNTQYVNITAGKITALGVDLSGKITATSGEIGGASITNGVLQIANANITSLDASKINSGSIAAARIAAGTITADKLAANTLHIGGHNLLKSSYLQKTNSTDYNIANVYLVARDKPVAGETVTIQIKGTLAATKTSWGIYNSGGSLQMTTLNSSNYDSATGIYTKTFEWKVTYGSTTAANTHISIYTLNNNQSGASSIEWVMLERGNQPSGWGLSADELGGFTITNSSIYNGTFGASGSVYISTGYGSSTSIGGSAGTSTWAFTAGNTFGVTTAGGLYATAGKIAGWTIESQQLYNGTLAADNSMYLATKNLGSNTTIAGRSGSDWRFTVGSNFGVTNTGAAYASNLVVGPSNGYHATIANSAFQVYNNTTLLSSFGTTTQIGASNANNFKITSTGIQMNALASGSTPTEVFYVGVDSRTARAGTESDPDATEVTTNPYYILGYTGYTSTITPGSYSVAEGYSSIASGSRSHAEGYQTIASGSQSHAEGQQTTASKYSSHAEGCATTASGDHSHAEGWVTTASGNDCHAEGTETVASGDYSHAEGSRTEASGSASHAEGWSTTADKQGSHAEGWSTTASGLASHAEGRTSKATGQYSHAEGSGSLASGPESHAEGIATTASGNYSHSEGFSTTASGDYSHAEGCSTIASGDYSHAGGFRSIASENYQTVIGKYNNVTTTTSGDETIYDAGDYAFIIGNGTTQSTSNALTVDWSGNLVASGTITGTSFNGNATSATTASSSPVLSYGSALTSLAAIDSHGTAATNLRVAKVNKITGHSGEGIENNDGMIMSLPWSSTYGHQLFFDDSGYSIAHRYNYSGTWHDWKLLLDSNNYTSYTVTKTGTGASGNWGINITGSSASCTGNSVTATTASNLSGFKNTTTSATAVDSATTNGVYYVNSTSGIYSQSDGAAFVQAYSTSWVAQIYQDYRTGQIALRGKNNGTWQSWRKVLDSSNYTDYTVTKTGTGASGSWGISITGSSASCTGNAATATTAGNVTGTVAIGNGGTGATSFTANSVIMSGSTTTSALTTRAVTNNTSASAITASTNIITANTLAYWNGAYSGTTSRLAYCNQGAFGTMATKNAADYATLSGATFTGAVTAPNIGNIQSATKTAAVSSSNTIDGTPAVGAQLTLDPGTYLICGRFVFGTASTTGTRNNQVAIYRGASPTNSTVVNHSITRVMAAANNWASLTTSTIVTHTSSTTYTVGGTSSRPESGSGGESAIYAVRLL